MLPFKDLPWIVQGIREGGDYGKPIVLNESNPAATAFMDLAVNAERQIAIRNAAIVETKVVETAI